MLRSHRLRAWLVGKSPSRLLTVLLLAVPPSPLMAQQLKQPTVQPPQQPAPPGHARYPDAEREELVPGFPIGDPAALHPKADWQLKSNIFLRTAKRYRVSLEGLWRFGPVLDPQEHPIRSEMGWLKLPGLWTDPEAIVYDATHKIAEGRWAGRPLSRYPVAWLERELYAPASWISKLIYITVRGPYADATLHVNGEPVAPSARGDDHVVYEVTSYLVYPGWNLLDLRKRVPIEQANVTAELPLEVPIEVDRPQPPSRKFTEKKPLIYVDVIPAGPHFESVTVRQEGPDTWVAHCQLGLPPIFPFPARDTDPVPTFDLVILEGGSREADLDDPVLHERFVLKKRPRKPLPFRFKLRTAKPTTLTLRLYEVANGTRVLRDEFYPIQIEAP